MRTYSDDLERDIRTERLVREWTASGLIDPPQRDRMLSDLQIDVRRTNIYLRLVLFVFTVMIIGASVLFVAFTIKVQDSGGAALCLIGAIVSFGIAELLTARYRVYRFGVEEGAVVAGILLATLAVVLLMEPSSGWSRSVAQASAAVTAMIAGFYAYRRYGFVYAAIAAALFGAAIPFQFDLSMETQRFFAALILGGFFVVFWFLCRSSENEFPADECQAIASASWLGIYSFLNLHLTTPFFRYFAGNGANGTFYEFTYGMIWILPAAGLFLAIHYKDRILLDVNIVMALATLMTNKPYLHGVQQTWDPILLGLVLIGIAVVVRQWLAKGAGGVRDGFTASRLLSSEKRKLSILGTASAALQGATMQHSHPHPTNAPPPAETYKPGGGRSGGAGASGSY